MAVQYNGITQAKPGGVLKTGGGKVVFATKYECTEAWFWLCVLLKGIRLGTTGLCVDHHNPVDFVVMQAQLCYSSFSVWQNWWHVAGFLAGMTHATGLHVADVRRHIGT